MNKSERLRSVDIARGIGILSIIVGHFGIPAIVRVVFTYHIPVFFLITGYFMKEEPIPLFLRKKVKTLSLLLSKIWMLQGFYGYGSRPVFMGQEVPIICRDPLRQSERSGSCWHPFGEAC